MSRSLHATRRDLAREQNPARRERVEEQLYRKHRIKSAVLAERRKRCALDVPASTRGIPIHVVDAGPFVHYPATPRDLEGVAARLPPGALGGIEAIEFSLGDDAQRPNRPGDWTGDPDPLTGRRGVDRLPGVWSGRILGEYLRAQNRIRVFGFVSREPLAEKPHFELHLRLRMLSTFVHEVGHHDDAVRRSACGRGRGVTSEDHEIYAQRRQHEWIQRCVVPYLEETYPREVAALLAWVEEHGGRSFPLGVLAGDPRVSVRGGFLRADGVFGGLPSALEDLARDVAKGLDRKATRLGFARELHYGDRFLPALEIVERVLADHADDLDALALKADLLEHLERHDEAERIARAVLERDPGSKEAWKTLALVFEAREQWTELLETAESALGLEADRWHVAFHIRDRARARIGLGDLAAACADIALLEQRGVNGEIQARRLRALMADFSTGPRPRARDDERGQAE